MTRGEPIKLFSRNDHNGFATLFGYALRALFNDSAKELAKARLGFVKLPGPGPDAGLWGHDYD